MMTDVKPTSVQTALMEAQRDNRVRAAMHRLLHELRRFMHAYPMREEYAMPPHDLEWVAEFKDGPAQTILEAMKTRPELWVHALPAEVCIVPKAMLERLIETSTNSDHRAIMLEALIHHGADIMENHAALARYEAEQKQEEARYRESDRQGEQDK